MDSTSCFTPHVSAFFMEKNFFPATHLESCLSFVNGAVEQLLSEWPCSADMYFGHGSYMLQQLRETEAC